MSLVVPFRYHSLHGLRESMPAPLRIIAETADGVVMGLQHESLPIAAVQFHPESILTLPKHGLRILQNALSILTSKSYEVNIAASNPVLQPNISSVIHS